MSANDYYWLTIAGWICITGAVCSIVWVLIDMYVSNRKRRIQSRIETNTRLFRFMVSKGMIKEKQPHGLLGEKLKGDKDAD